MYLPPPGMDYYSTQKRALPGHLPPHDDDEKPPYLAAWLVIPLCPVIPLCQNDEVVRHEIQKSRSELETSECGAKNDDELGGPWGSSA